MRQALRRAVVKTGSVPSPVGGLNARDSIANMKATDAVIMDNWVPSTTSVGIRKGYTSWATGLPSTVETLMPYRSATASKLFAASGTAFYDVTTQAAVGAAVQSGLANARWQWANFGTIGGQFLYCVNGADSARLYNGSSWVTITAVSTPAITGVTTSLLKDVQVYARRLWFVEKNSFRVWYLPVDSIGGAATSIDFSSLFILGGSLQGMVPWTVTSEYGSTTYAAFISSEGEVLLYEGTNPDSASNWQLAGQFRVGKPIGQRFWTRAGSDTILITDDGLIPMSKAAFTNRQSQSDAISFKITNLVNNDIASYKSNFGWQVVLYPLGNKLICNAPRFNSSDTVQYVMNTITNAWCRYTTIPAQCWAVTGDDLYFGGTNKVYKAEYGNNDDGAAIKSDIMPAFSYFGGQGQQKMFTATRPIISATGNFSPRISLELDFNLTDPTSAPNLSLARGASLWDTALWDTGLWGGSETLSRNWQYVGGIGFAATIRMQSLTQDMQVDWQSTDYVWEPGGIF